MFCEFQKLFMNDQLMNKKMVFILGRGRSGSTLLSSMLDVHPSISFAPEGQFVMNLYKKYKGAELSEKRREEFLQDIWLEKRMLDWSLDVEALFTQVMDLPAKATFGDLCTQVYLCHAIAKGKPNPVYLGDKNPLYALFSRELVTIFPEAKFILLVRDYRSNIVSYKNVRFDLHNSAGLAYRWNVYNKSIDEASREYPDKFILVRYEDIILHVEKELKRICNFLGLPMYKEMLDYHKGRASQIAQKYSWHQKLAIPPDASNLNEWKKQLAGKELELAEKICGRAGEISDYPLSAMNSGNLLYPGILLGWLRTFLEKYLFRLPLSVRSTIITVFRKLTGSL
jgi:hypothetical protein